MREVMMCRLDLQSLAELEQLQAQLGKELDVWRQRWSAATGVVVIRGAGRRSRQQKSFTVKGRRDPSMLKKADAEIATLRRYLSYIEKELARRAAGEAARA